MRRGSPRRPRRHERSMGRADPSSSGSGRLAGICFTMSACPWRTRGPSPSCSPAHPPPSAPGRTAGGSPATAPAPAAAPSTTWTKPSPSPPRAPHLTTPVPGATLSYQQVPCARNRVTGPYPSPEAPVGDIPLKRIVAAAGLILAAVALLAAVVSGFSAPGWVLPAGVLALAIVLVV